MKKEKIRRYRKTELLELLIRLRTENDELRAELEECKSKLADKNIAIESAGSIAEAAMRLSGIFEAAQAACDQYTENLAARSEAQSIQSEAAGAEAPDDSDDMFNELLEWWTGQAGKNA